LARVGIDDVVGTVIDPAEQLVDSPDLAVASSRLTATQVRDRLAEHPDIQVLDVRGPGEHAEGALPGALNLPLPRLRTMLDALDPHRPVLVHCAGGYRSMVGASLLEAHGFTDVSDLIGGQGAWEASAEEGATA
jgi:hydroxyacylglutathione hydrolase